MKNILKNTVATLTALSIINTQLVANSSHCTQDENIVFSCNTGKKFVSVCASKNLSSKNGYIQYRFGKLGSPEAIIPANPLLFKKNMSAVEATIGASQRLIAHGLKFKNDQFSYEVNSNIDMGTSSIYVSNKGKLLVTLTCQEDGLLVDNIYDYNFKSLGIHIENE